MKKNIDLITKKESEKTKGVNFFLNYKNTTLYYHVKEFRLRAFYVIFSIFTTFLFCYFYRFECIYIFSKPFLTFQKNFIFTDLTEAFSATYIICTIFAVFFTLPVVYYQIWCFSIPSFFFHERQKITRYTWILFFLYGTTNILIYFYIMPEIYKFFLYFELKSTTVTLRLEPKIYSYILLTSRIYMLLISIFSIPLIIYCFFNKIKVILDFLSKNRKSINVFFLLCAAFISPPDIFSQFLLGFVFFSFFEICLWCGFYSKRKSNKSIHASSIESIHSGFQ